MFKRQKTRYLLTGGLNTLFGYAVGVCSYKLFSDHAGIVWAAVFANILAISFSFVTYKLFVFRTKGHWFVEYTRAYIVYGSSALLSVLLLWVLIDWVRMSIWMAQGVVLIVTVAVSYLGHAKFTFQRKLPLRKFDVK